MSRRFPFCSGDELKVFVEERLGQAIVVFKWINETAGTDNFLCVTRDGRKLVVKNVSGKDACEHACNFTIAHLQDLASLSEAIHLAHGPWKKAGGIVFAMTFCPGRPVRPDRLSRRQEENLIRGYSNFSGAIQSERNIAPAYDIAALREDVLQSLNPMRHQEIRAFVEHEMPVEAVTYDPTRLRVIHGDFHRKNFFFVGDELSGFLDYEAFRWGYPAEDWLRYLVASAEHMNPFNLWRRFRRLALFERLLPLYPIDEWRLAIDELLLRRIHQCVNDPKASPVRTLRFFRWRFRFYRELHRRIVARQEG